MTVALLRFSEDAMEDKYNDLRAALDAGPKPGKWTWKQVGSFNTPGCAVLWPDSSKGGTHYRRLDFGGGMELVDAEFIAAAHPETIRALLEERDALREVLLREADWHDGEARAHKIRAKNSSGVYDGLKAEWHREREQHIRAALAQEQENKP
jgi:hypothetical protein